MAPLTKEDFKKFSIPIKKAANLIWDSKGLAITTSGVFSAGTIGWGIGGLVSRFDLSKIGKEDIEKLGKANEELKKIKSKMGVSDFGDCIFFLKRELLSMWSSAKSSKFKVEGSNLVLEEVRDKIKEKTSLDPSILKDKQRINEYFSENIPKGITFKEIREDLEALKEVAKHFKNFEGLKEFYDENWEQFDKLLGEEELKAHIGKLLKSFHKELKVNERFLPNYFQKKVEKRFKDFFKVIQEDLTERMPFIEHWDKMRDLMEDLTNYIIENFGKDKFRSLMEDRWNLWWMFEDWKERREPIKEFKKFPCPDFIKIREEWNELVENNLKDGVKGNAKLELSKVQEWFESCKKNINRSLQDFKDVYIGEEDPKKTWLKFLKMEMKILAYFSMFAELIRKVYEINFGKNLSSSYIPVIHKFIELLFLNRAFAKALIKYSYYPNWLNAVKKVLEDYWGVDFELEETPIFGGYKVLQPDERWVVKKHILWKLHYLPLAQASEYFSGMGEELCHYMRDRVREEFKVPKHLQAYFTPENWERISNFFEEHKTEIYILVSEFFGMIGKLLTLDTASWEEFASRYGINGEEKENIESKFEWWKEHFYNPEEKLRKEEIESIYMRERILEELGELYGKRKIKEKKRKKLSEQMESLHIDLLEEVSRDKNHVWEKADFQHTSQDKVKRYWELIKRLDERTKKYLIKAPAPFVYLWFLSFPFGGQAWYSPSTSEGPLPLTIEEFYEKPIEYCLEGILSHLMICGVISKDLKSMPEEVSRYINREKGKFIKAPEDFLKKAEEKWRDMIG